jgi:Neutral trehalase
MLFYDRSDGKRIRALRPFDAILPYVIRKRNEAAVLFSRDVDVEAAMAYVRAKNAEPSAAAGSAAKSGVTLADDRYSLFGVLVAAVVRTLALKPRMNRFVHRRGVYQRSSIAVSFIVKKSFTEALSEGHAKIRFEPEDGVAEVMEKISRGIELARSGEPGPDDREYGLAHRIPFGKALLTGLFSVLDRFNVAPASMIEADPLFTSVYIANLGSIGLDTPYHHLYEWGSASVFMVVGRIFQKETRRGSGTELRHYVNVKFTVDERIAEGIYYAHAMALFQKLIAKPELLEEAPNLAEVEE